MTTATERRFQQYVDESTTLGPIVAATDGTDEAAVALKAAGALARHSGAEVIVLTVLEGLPLLAADYGMIIPPMDADDGRRKALMHRVREQVSALGREAEGWKIEMREGDPASTIARTARELKARLIVCGLGHHDLLDRLFGGETALHALRLARTPILAVPPTFRDLPRRVVVAMDFSAPSINAARQALRVVDTARNIWLVHVAPTLEVQHEAFNAWMKMFGEGIGPAFDRAKAEIGLSESVIVESVPLKGKPTKELLAFARSNQADLIITGSRGAGLIDRILVGSTATGILRGAECAVLAVPGGGGELEQDWPQGDRIEIAHEDWAVELDAFTRRNIGRRASLEVDDPDLGAQAQEHSYPFLGTAWDHHDERVEIMLGDFEGVGYHLTRGIGGVTSIDVLRDDHGRDQVLRVAHGTGQTVLSFDR